MSKKYGVYITIPVVVDHEGYMEVEAQDEDEAEEIVRKKVLGEMNRRNYDRGSWEIWQWEEMEFNNTDELEVINE